MSTTSNSSAVNVLNNNSGFDGSLSVQVAQLASASTLKSGKLSGSINVMQARLILIQKVQLH